MRKIIVPVGYMGSGSSAVTDLISEFENVNNDYGQFEYVFLHCPNGVFDLEDKLLIGNNALRSDEAIRTFLHQMKELYDKKYWWVGGYKQKISPKFYARTEEYINELIDFKQQDYWYYQEKTNFRMFIQLVIRKIVYYITFKKVLLKKPLLYDTMYISYPTPEKFYKTTKKYIYDIFNLIDSGQNDLLLDQLLLPHNLYRVDNYFDDDIRIIVVDRDPRDVFISNKYMWKPNLRGVPFSNNVQEFCKQFKRIKEIETPVKSNKVLRIHFEDLIYKYEETKDIIIKFLGYEKRKHVNQYKTFNPEISFKNTQIFNAKEYEKEVKYIEKELKDYLYEFPYKKENDIRRIIL